MLDQWLNSLQNNQAETGNFFKSKKGRYLIIIAISLGLLALVWNPSPDTDQQQTTMEISQSIVKDNSVKEQMSRELKMIVSRIEGAGKVEVSITLASDGEKSYASNISEEKSDIEEIDSQGVRKQSAETRSTKELAVSSGDFLLIESKSPQVLGVLIVAEGAKNPEVKEKITTAAATLFDIPTYKVSVMAGQGGEL